MCMTLCYEINTFDYALAIVSEEEAGPTADRRATSGRNESSPDSSGAGPVPIARRKEDISIQYQ